MHFRPFAALAALSLITACGGGAASPVGSNSGSSPSQSPPPSGKQASATVHFTIPNATTPAGAHRAFGKRRPDYVSPGSLGAIVVATSKTTNADNETYGFDLHSAGTCTASAAGASCTAEIPLFADTYSIAISLYDTSEAGKAAAPAGHLLSTDTEDEVIVSGALNDLTNFLLHAEVDSFTASGTVGAAGGTPFSTNPTASFVAFDAGGYNVDGYGNPAVYANAPLDAVVSDNGDATGCSSPCFGAMNDANYTISKQSNLAFTLGYNGGGGPGAGIAAWVAGAAPTGQRPSFGTVVATGARASGTIVTAPLYSYPAALTQQETLGYVWAAQAAPPAGANQTSGSYAAYFGTPGTTACGAIATIGKGTYYPGYGEVFPITAGSNGTCMLTLSDGAAPADIRTLALTIALPATTVSVPCAMDTAQPVGSAIVTHRLEAGRRRSAAAGAAPALVQYATGVEQVALANPVTAGDTLVTITGDGVHVPSYPSSYALFTGASEGAEFVYTTTVASSGAFGYLAANDGCNTAIWLGEFSGTSEAAMRAANAGSDSTKTASTPAIVPNAANGLLITSFVTSGATEDTSAATATAGFTEYFVRGPQTALDVQLATTPTANTTTPVSNTFANTQAQAGTAGIFQIPPAN